MRFVFFVVGVMSLATTGVLFPVAKADCPLSFADDVPYGVGNAPYYAAAVDLDGDGDLDLAVANSGLLGGVGNVSVLLNNGEGTFAAHVLYGAGDTPVSVTAADLDGDGDLDLATANFYSDNVSILFNRRIE